MRRITPLAGASRGNVDFTASLSPVALPGVAVVGLVSPEFCAWQLLKIKKDNTGRSIFCFMGSELKNIKYHYQKHCQTNDKVEARSVEKANHGAFCGVPGFLFIRPVVEQFAYKDAGEHSD